jgi:hypothetical protein
LTPTTFSLNSSAGNGGYAGGGLVGITGTAKIDETPSYNELIGNTVYYNKDDGIRINLLSALPRSIILEFGAQINGRRYRPTA